MGMKSPATRRYLRRFSVMMAAYLLFLFPSVWVIRHWHPEGALLVALSVLPALPIVGVLVVIGLYLAELTDEFVRNRIVLSMLFGTGTVLSVGTALAFLRNSKVIGEVDLMWAFPLWCLAWGLTQCVLTLRDRPGAES